MSKSGVFAHFGSREELQISVVHEYHDRFEQEVFYPAIEAPRGIPRLRELFGNWMKRTSMEIDSGCIYISGAVEFDDRTARCAMRWSNPSAPGWPPCAAPSCKARNAAICVPMPMPASCCSRFTA
jgi:AcrR family transcriptional regulator